MAEGIQLRLTHTAQRASNILIDDIRGETSGGGRRGVSPEFIYVPAPTPANPNPQVTLTYGGAVPMSFERGDIRGFINNGDLTAEFIIGGLAQDASDGPVTIVAVAGGASPDVYNATKDDSLFLVDTTNDAVRINLPAGADHLKKRIRVIDVGGNAAVNNITTFAEAPNTIAGGVSDTLSIGNGDVEYIYNANGTDWFSIVRGTGGPPAGPAGGDLSGAYPNPNVAQVGGVAAATVATNLPSSDEKAAFTGTAGVPSAANPYVTDSDARLTDSRAPSGPAGGDLSGAYPNPSVNDGADGSALHDDTAGEISAIAEKVAPVGTDLLVIEDSADANNKKRIQIGNLPGGPPSGPAGGDLSGAYPNPSVALVGGTAAATVAANLPSADEKSALSGTDGVPGAANPYVTDSDPRNTDSRTPSGAAGGDLSGAYPNPTVNDGADSTAIHDDTAGEIAAVAEKVAPVNADLLLIEDSADLNNKKRVQIGNLPGSGETNTASNVNTAGVGVFKQKTGVDLEFRGVNAASSKVTVVLDAANNEIDVDVADASTAQAGAIEIATQAEVDAGTSTTLAVTPDTLANATTIILNGQAAGGELSGTYPNPTVNDGADGSAIHDDTAGEIAAVALKAVPVNADLILIEDSADTNNKKRITIGSLPAGGGEANTASNTNVGGVGVFSQKTGVDLEFRGINAASSKVTVALDAGNNEIDVDVADASTTQAGAIEIATQAEVDAGVSTTLAVTPAGLASATTVILNGQAAGGDLGGTYPNPTVNDGADSTAIHDDTAGEIAAVALKGTPVSADILLIEDSADANNKKRITVGSLPTGGGETNTASNVNTAGVGVFKQKTGVDLEFRGVNAASSKVTVALDAVNDEIDVDVADASTTQAGAIEIATQAEVDAGTSTTLAVTPGTLANATTIILNGQAAGGELGGTFPNPTVNDGADGSAIHDDTAGEIAAVALKGTPVSGDFLLIEDSADSNNKKRITVGSLPTGGGGEANTASNVNVGGVGVFKQKTGVDLEFRGINAASAKATVALDAGNNEIDIDVADASTTQAGAIEIATQAEVDAGVSTTLAVTPAGLASATTVILNGQAAGGDLGGTYPNPTVGDLTITGEAQGDVLYFNGANWVRLAAGTNGDFLQTQGAGANPIWATVAGVDHTTLSNLTWTASGHTGTASRIASFDALGNATYVQIGVDVQAWDADLDGLSVVGTTGIVSRIGAGTFTTRTITGTAGNITVTNGGGLAGNPTIDVGANVFTTASSDHAALTNNLTWSTSGHTGTASTFAAFTGAGAATNLTTTGAGDTSGTWPNLLVNDLTIAGEAQGDILYFNGANWVRLAAGTSGQLLQTQGAGANPIWVDEGLLKVTGNDTTPGYLFDKLITATTGVAFTEVNDAGDEDLRLDIDTASTTGQGLIELATQAEVDAGASALLAVTPATLANATTVILNGQAAGGELSGTYPNPTVNDGADGSAIHDDTAGEIAAVTLKGTPVNADILLIEDSADLNNKKRITIGSLPSSGETNTASNVNVGGVGVFKQKTGVDLEFRGINAASAKVTVALDAVNNEIDLDVADASTTQAGAIEIATQAEVDAGASTTLAVTPATLASAATVATSLQTAYGLGNTIVTAGATDIAFTLTSGGFFVQGGGAVAFGNVSEVASFSAFSGGTATVQARDTTLLDMQANDAGTKTLTISASNAGAGEGRVSITSDAQVSLSDGTGTLLLDGGALSETGMTSASLSPSGAVDLVAGAASQFTTSAGALTLDGNGGVNVLGNAAEVDITTTGAVDINSGAGTWDASTLSLDATDDTNLTMTANDAGTKTLTISSTNAGAGVGDLDIDADGQITVGGTNTTAATIQVAGGVDTEILKLTQTTGESFGMFAGSADPSGSVTANAGSLFVRDTGATAELYQNTSVGSGTTWTQLSGGGGGGITPAQHKALNDLIHFIDDGPADGFASGSVKDTSYNGGLVTQEIWYTSAGRTQKIVQLDVTYDGALPVTEVWQMFDAAGVLSVTLTDAITYSGALETSRSRTWV